MDGILTSQSFGPGWKYVHNASGGRGLALYGGVTIQPSSDDAVGTGIDAIYQDQAVIKSAQAIVLELGTNANESGLNCPGPDGFASAVKQAIADIHAIRGNSPVKLYWVNIGNYRTDSCAWTIGPRDQTLDALSRPLGYTVIDWHGQTKAHPEWFTGDPIHPDTAGRQALAQLITTAVARG
jgi:hypothetical protein